MESGKRRQERVLSLPLPLPLPLPSPFSIFPARVIFNILFICCVLFCFVFVFCLFWLLLERPEQAKKEVIRF